MSPEVNESYRTIDRNVPIYLAVSATSLFKLLVTHLLLIHTQTRCSISELVELYLKLKALLQHTIQQSYPLYTEWQLCGGEILLSPISLPFTRTIRMQISPLGSK